MTKVTDSILLTVKKRCNIDPIYPHFDDELLVHINAVFLTLNQLNVGPKRVFSIEDSSRKWTDFVQDEDLVGAVREYVANRVKLVFDPPQSSAAVEALKDSISEYEFRILLYADD